MRITAITPYVVNPDIPGLPDDLSLTYCFVRVDTDEGISGWGECSNWPSGGTFMTAFGVQQMREHIIGKDAGDTESIWRDIFNRWSYLGHRGMPTAVASAIDIALWDIKGKALGRPVYDLLGGKFRDEVRLYANGWFTTGSTPGDFARDALRTVEEGHDAMKLDPFIESGIHWDGGGISHAGEQEGYDIVAAVREAVGPDVEILIDAHGMYDVPNAIRLANNLFEQSNIAWFEEPLPPESYKGLAQVRSQVNAPICVGERLYTRWDFVPVLEDGLADYLMPDAVWTGGISELKKIATMAEAYYVPISPHNAMGPLQIAAGANVMMTVPNFYRLEHCTSWIPAYNSFLKEPFDFHDGKLKLSGKPGLGVDVDQEKIDASVNAEWAAIAG
jgi:galactonate dehydratase